MIGLEVRDASGRYIAPPQSPAPAPRPAGPWDANAAAAAPAPLRVICAWCPDFDRTAPINAGATHGICPTCAKGWK